MVSSSTGYGWILRQVGDDFIVLGPTNSTGCQNALNILTSLCRELGVPLALHKQVNPTTLPGVPGYRGRLQCQVTETPSRQTGQTADHARGMV